MNVVETASALCVARTNTRIMVYAGVIRRVCLHITILTVRALKSKWCLFMLVPGIGVVSGGRALS